MKNLQNQAKPKGVELADDEFILHVEGTASTQRVVRHIGGTSWPGLSISLLFIVDLCMRLFQRERRFLIRFYSKSC